MSQVPVPDIDKIDTLDKEFEIVTYSPVCSYCKHLEDMQARKCAAYPEVYGIPIPIWSGENDHRQPYAGDGGIQFERIKPERA